MRASYVLVVLGAGASGCAAEHRLQPQAVDVRLGVVANTLAHVEKSYEDDRPPGTRADRETLSRALHDARGSLDFAERAVASWEAGDPRAWASVRPCLAANLVRVDEALVPLKWLPPPGLTQVVAVKPFERCAWDR
jgi:hypothetical protein